MSAPSRTLLVTAGSQHKQPWWWNDIAHDPTRCQLDHQTVLVEGGRLSRIFSLQSLGLFLRVCSILFRGRHNYRYVFTFECGWLSFAIAFIQTLTWYRRPRHVILQFIMRERKPSLSSRLKYLFMRWCFSSVHLCVCSSRAECRYYEDAFQWPPEKLVFVPLHTDPRLLAEDYAADEGFVIAAGRTFRDYGTLVQAFRGLEVPLVIVASPSNVGLGLDDRNITLKYDIPGAELVALISRSLAVVLPLENRKISIGQSVLLQAMSMAKPVIATKVAGTEDYVEHMKTGILVPPHDPDAIREAVAMLVNDADLRARLGRAALDRMRQEYLPQHYADAVTRCLERARSASRT